MWLLPDQDPNEIAELMEAWLQAIVPESMQ